ncbi:MAG: hypothetical protein ACI90Y_001940, partial [Polaromonas sp.]
YANQRLRFYCGSIIEKSWHFSNKTDDGDGAWTLSK